MNRTYVLDASALLVFLLKDAGSVRILQLLKDADRTGVPILVSVVNWGEVERRWKEAK